MNTTPSPATRRAPRSAPRPSHPRSSNAAGTPLPLPLRHALEALSGLCMADVRVHRGSALPSLLGARAFAYGERIHLAHGAEDALPHEAWHVVQQKQGRVRATATLNGLPLNDDAALEAEAEAMAGEAARMAEGGRTPAPRVLGRGRVEEPVVQRVVTITEATEEPADNWRPASWTINEHAGFLEAIQNALHLGDATVPDLSLIALDLIDEGYTFRTWREADKEIRIRGVGYHVVRTLEGLVDVHRPAYDEATAYVTRFKQQADADWVAQMDQDPNTRRYATADDWIAAKTREQAQAYSDVMLWNNASYTAVFAEQLLQRQMFNWLRGERNEAPLRMNCWEFVFYGLVISGYAGREYLTWINHGKNIKTQPPRVMECFWASESNMTEEWRSVQPKADADLHDPQDQTLPVQGGAGSWLQQDRRVSQPETWTNEKLFYIDPAWTIPRGRVIMFGQGEHVAISTGRRVPIASAQRALLFGYQNGHEIVELDGEPVNAPRRATIQDLDMKYLGLPMMVFPFPICTETRAVPLQGTVPPSSQDVDRIIARQRTITENKWEAKKQASQNTSQRKLQIVQKRAEATKKDLTSELQKLQTQSARDLEELEKQKQGEIIHLQKTARRQNPQAITINLQITPQDPYGGMVTLP